MFSMRIVTADHYMTAPVRGLDVCYSDFRGCDVKKVPVLRVYGITPAGQKTCMHVHGVLPYLYVPYDGAQPTHRYIRQFTASLDKALNVAMGRASSTVQHVYKVALVSGIPFYGYQEEERPFLKIYLYNPLMVKKVADLLLAGAVMNKIYQPHETHIPYNLQIFIDYNLYGMNMLNTAAVKFRRPAEGDGVPGQPRPEGQLNSPGMSSMLLPSLQEAEESENKSFSCPSPTTRTWGTENIPGELWLDGDVPRQSKCELEVDVVAADILNRLDVGDKMGSNPGLVALWEDEKQRRREKGDDSMITPPDSPERVGIQWTDEEEELQQQLKQILLDLQPYLSDEEPDEEVSPSLSPSNASSPRDDVHHQSPQLSDDSVASSQDTILLGGDEEENQPIINELSILRVVSSSQSFRDDREDDEEIPCSQVLSTTQDRSLAQMLASLAEPSSPASSASSQMQSQIAALEEQDSILSQLPSQPLNQLQMLQQLAAMEDEDEQLESLEMSQHVWPEAQDEGTQQQDGDQRDLSAEFDFGGMDQSWNSSQWEDVQPQGGRGRQDEQPTSEHADARDAIPQLDGPVDDKAEYLMKGRRRLGVRGPAMATRPRPMAAGSFSISAHTGDGRSTTFTSTNKVKKRDKFTNGSREVRPVETAAPVTLAVPVNGHGKNESATANSPSSPKVTFDLRTLVPIHGTTQKTGDVVDDLPVEEVIAAPVGASIPIEVAVHVADGGLVTSQIVQIPVIQEADMATMDLPNMTQMVEFVEQAEEIAPVPVNSPPAAGPKTKFSLQKLDLTKVVQIQQSRALKMKSKRTMLENAGTFTKVPLQMLEETNSQLAATNPTAVQSSPRHVSSLSATSSPEKDNSRDNIFATMSLDLSTSPVEESVKEKWHSAVPGAQEMVVVPAAQESLVRAHIVQSKEPQARRHASKAAQATKDDVSELSGDLFEETFNVSPPIKHKQKTSKKAKDKQYSWIKDKSQFVGHEKVAAKQVPKSRTPVVVEDQDEEEFKDLSDDDSNTPFLVKRRRSSESSSGESEVIPFIRVGEHSKTYAPRSYRPGSPTASFTKVLDKSRPFEELVAELQESKEGNAEGVVSRKKDGRPVNDDGGSSTKKHPSKLKLKKKRTSESKQALQALDDTEATKLETAAAPSESREEECDSDQGLGLNKKPSHDCHSQPDGDDGSNNRAVSLADRKAKLTLRRQQYLLQKSGSESGSFSLVPDTCGITTTSESPSDVFDGQCVSKQGSNVKPEEGKGESRESERDVETLPLPPLHIETLKAEPLVSQSDELAQSSPGKLSTVGGSPKKVPLSTDPKNLKWVTFKVPKCRYHHSDNRQPVDSDPAIDRAQPLEVPATATLPAKQNPDQPTTEVRARVYRYHWKKFDLENRVNKELLVLYKMTPADIKELKQQVRREMEHKRTEHIMPLVMNLSHDEIEDAYAGVTEQIRQELQGAGEYTSSEAEEDEDEEDDDDKSESKSSSDRTSLEDNEQLKLRLDESPGGGAGPDSYCISTEDHPAAEPETPDKSRAQTKDGPQLQHAMSTLTSGKSFKEDDGENEHSQNALTDDGNVQYSETEIIIYNSSGQVIKTDAKLKSIVSLESTQDLAVESASVVEEETIVLCCSDDEAQGYRRRRRSESLEAPELPLEKPLELNRSGPSSASGEDHDPCDEEPPVLQESYEVVNVIITSPRHLSMEEERELDRQRVDQDDEPITEVHKAVAVRSKSYTGGVAGLPVTSVKDTSSAGKVSDGGVTDLVYHPKNQGPRALAAEVDPHKKSGLVEAGEVVVQRKELTSSGGALNKDAPRPDGASLMKALSLQPKSAPSRTPSRSSDVSRRSSEDGGNGKSADMSEVDFSVLENTLDTDNEGAEPLLHTAGEPDSHKQLHTPPIALDSDQGQMPLEKSRSTDVASAEAPGTGNQLRSTNDNVNDAPVNLLLEYSESKDADQRSKKPDARGQSHEQHRVSRDDEARPSVSRKETSEKHGSSKRKRGRPPRNRTERKESQESMTISEGTASEGMEIQAADGRKQWQKHQVKTDDKERLPLSRKDTSGEAVSRKKKRGRPPRKKLERKESQESLTISEGTGSEEMEGHSKSARKRKVFEQMDHYRYRTKRVAVDYSPAAFAHFYKDEGDKVPDGDSDEGEGEGRGGGEKSEHSSSERHVMERPTDKAEKKPVPSAQNKVRKEPTEQHWERDDSPESRDEEDEETHQRKYSRSYKEADIAKTGKDPLYQEKSSLEYMCTDDVRDNEVIYRERESYDLASAGDHFPGPLTGRSTSSTPSEESDPRRKAKAQSARKFQGVRKLQVVLDRMTVKLKDTRLDSSQSSSESDYLSDLDEGSSSQLGKTMGLASRKIATDLLMGDQVDPLWEAQKERLAELPERDKKVKVPAAATSPGAEAHTNLQSEAAAGDEPHAEKKSSPKKKMTSMHKRLSNAFVKPSSRRAKKKTDSLKFLNTLSLLHQATMESLTSSSGDQETDRGPDEKGEDDEDDDDSVHAGQEESSPRETYGKKVEPDHDVDYEDAMYRMALVSPAHSEETESSPPEPKSPTGPAAPEKDKEPVYSESVVRLGRSLSTSQSSVGSIEESQFSVNDLSRSSGSPETFDQDKLVKRDKGFKDNPPYTVKTEIVRLSGNGGKSSPVATAIKGLMGGSSAPNSPRCLQASSSPLDLGLSFTTVFSRVSPQNLHSGKYPTSSLSSSPINQGRQCQRSPTTDEKDTIHKVTVQVADELTRKVSEEVPQDATFSVATSSQGDVEIASLDIGAGYAKDDSFGIEKFLDDLGKRQKVASSQVEQPLDLEQKGTRMTLKDTIVEQPSNTVGQVLLPTERETLAVSAINVDPAATLSHVRQVEEPAAVNQCTEERGENKQEAHPSEGTDVESQSLQDVKHTAAGTCDTAVAHMSDASNQETSAVSKRKESPAVSEEHHSETTGGKRPRLDDGREAEVDKESEAMEESLPNVVRVMDAPKSPTPSPIHSPSSCSPLESPASSPESQSPRSPESSSELEGVSPQSHSYALQSLGGRLSPEQQHAPMLSPEHQSPPRLSPSPLSPSPQSPSPQSPPPPLSPPPKLHRHQSALHESCSPQSPSPKSPSPQSPSPHSPSPIRSPDPFREEEVKPEPDIHHHPAVIPLTIEDPEIQEEVEKARFAKLRKLLGRSISKSSHSGWKNRPPPVDGVPRVSAHGATKTTVTPPWLPLSYDPSVPRHVPTSGTEQGGGNSTASSSSLFSPSTSLQSQAASSQINNSRSRSDQFDSPRSPDPAAPDGIPLHPASGGITILRPTVAPPSRDRISGDMLRHGLGDYQAREPHCGNPEDLPERPRELSGRALKIQSNVISDLPDFDTGSMMQGLKTWQAFAARQYLQSLGNSQATTFDLAGEMQRNPQLRASVIGNREVVITPCMLPPSGEVINKWLEGRELYRKAKAEDEKAKDDHHTESRMKKQNLEAKTSPSLKSDEEPSAMKPPASSGQDGTPAALFKMPVKWPLKGRRSSDSSLILDGSATPLPRASTLELHTPTPSPSPPDSSGEVGSPTLDPPSPLSPCRIPSVAASPSSRKRSSSFEGLLSSTPVKGHSFSEEQAEVAIPCTPIVKAPRGPEEEGAVPNTPGISPVERVARRRRLTRRLSTGTAASLRRVLLTSQLKNQFGTPATSRADVSQIEGPTPKNSFGFKISQQNVQDAKALHEFQYVTVMSMELHARTRGDLRPDPECDPVLALFYSIFHDVPPEKGERKITGVIVVDENSANQDSAGSHGASFQPFTPKKEATNRKPTTTSRDPADQPSTSKMAANQSVRAPSRDYAEPSTSETAQPQNTDQLLLNKSGLASVRVTYVKNEVELIDEFVALVQRWDPDILVGYEIQMLSWGFLLQRAAHISVNLCPQLARVQDAGRENRYEADKDEYGADDMSEIHVAGRVVLNLWRLLRHEVTLNVYSFENAAYHVLHQRIPLYPFRSLSEWFDHRTHLKRWRTLEHYIIRARATLQIMHQLDMIGQTSELARVFGIEFYHVLSRGTQYRVESMMMRIAKPMNYIPVSPSVQQRARMRAPECIPLTLEPESRLYTHPVVVVDFQSLYPSIMIAHNYCYSTCLGRLEGLTNCQDGPFDFGASCLEVPPKVLKKLKDDVTICPNGVVFVREHIRKGVLSSMVEEILKTRLMVKKSMKQYKGDKTLERLLHARQLGLKLIANVTFGYTAASFSGRMPCMEVGDSIVRKARETLERAIHLVENTPKWGARVVYGDTDSMFIELKGRTKDQAFVIGQEIADAVTNDNPKPIKLRFEKVYLPSVLQTKKRYVGFMYETPDQKEPVFDAKGIETVRRDGCGAVSKILERSIKLMFSTLDVSRVKQYVQRQCQKLMEGHVSVQDCVFAKEYRGFNGYKAAACVPALEIAKRCLAKDRRSEPRSGERVPYVIVYGPPGLPLIQLVRAPHEVLKDPSLRINATYYITKQILPPLERMFSLMGVDVRAWYNDLPRTVRTVPASHFGGDTKKGTISQYFTTLNCPVCEEVTNQGMCVACRQDPQRVAVVLASRMRAWERVYYQLMQICTNCMGSPDPELPCMSLDCPILFRLNKACRDQAQVPQLQTLQKKMLQY